MAAGSSLAYFLWKYVTLKYYKLIIIIIKKTIP